MIDILLFYLIVSFWGLEILFISLSSDYLSLIILSVPFFISITIILGILFIFAPICQTIIIVLGILIILEIIIQFYSLFIIA